MLARSAPRRTDPNDAPRRPGPGSGNIGSEEHRRRGTEAENEVLEGESVQARTPVQLAPSAPADPGVEERPRPSTASVARLFDQHAPYVGRTLRCLGVRDHELSDVLQEVFLLAHDRLPPFEHDATARERAWLYAICVRKALSARRDAARRALREVRDEARVAEAPGAHSPHDELERTRKLAQAMAILEQLDEDKRAVFVLHEVEQLAMSEVATIVGTPLQTAYSRLYAAKKEIAASLRRLRARGTVE
jgi:RNA polymerase sigma-70 factor (ECF subfamily)